MDTRRNQGGGPRERQLAPALKPLNAAKDFLTNCYAREGILPFLKKMEEEYLANKRPFSILIVDVDHFKSFNDKYGHLMGDEVLKYFSSSMRLDLEDEQNAPFRFGGDEFVMVFPNKTPADAQQLATRLRKNIRTRSCLIKGKQISITFSGGIAGYPADANSIEDILDKADKALYYSKNHGRSRITRYSDLNKQELFQVVALVLVLVIVGAGLYTFRDELSNHIGKIETLMSGLNFGGGKSSVSGKPGDLPTVVPPEPPVSPGGEPASTVRPPTILVTPESEKSRIYLESGRVVTGVIKEDDGDEIQVEVGLQEGKGMLQIKKSQVLRIETGNKPPKQLQ